MTSRSRPSRLSKYALSLAVDASLACRGSKWSGLVAGSLEGVFGASMGVMLAGVDGEL
jgi:hypothetical protein